MITDLFLDKLNLLANGGIGKSSLEKVRKAFADYYACTLAGSKSLEEYSLKLLPVSLRNGICSHVLELDDGHRYGGVHVGGTVFSALLAIAERNEICTEDFLRGVVVGYETTVRLACCIQPENKLKGYHATGTCGTIGAAVGAAVALHYSTEQLKTVVSAACTSAAGLLEMQENRSTLKSYNVGRAAYDAVAAVLMGMTGFQGPDDPLGGRRGFLSVMSDNPHFEFLTQFSNEPLCIESIYQKSYAACRHAHPAIEAALYLRDKIDISKIDEIDVRVYSLAKKGHDHTDITGISSAKMSIPFGVALALQTGNAGLRGYADSNIQDPRIQSLCKKVRVEEDPELTSLCPQKRASVLTIRSGMSTVTHRIDYPKGEPENPLSDKELTDKFVELTSYSGISKTDALSRLSLILKKNFSVREMAYSISIQE